jgi:hypothetical protein
MGVERLHGEPGEDQAACTGPDGGACDSACDDGFADQAAMLQHDWQALARRGPAAWTAAQAEFRRTVGAAAPECAAEDAGAEASPRDIAGILERLAARSDALCAAGEALQGRCARRIGGGAAGEAEGAAGGSRGGAGVGLGREYHAAARKRELEPLFKLGANLFCVGDCVSVNGSESEVPFIAQLLKFDRQTQLLTVRWLYRADEVHDQVGRGGGSGAVVVGVGEGARQRQR